MKIYLIRHGESTSDVEDRYGGTYDDHLTKKGKEQARILAEKIKTKKIKHIFTSPYLRASETAQVLGKKLNCEIITLDDIRERNAYGILTGMKKTEAAKKHPELVALLQDYQNTPPRGEDYSHFAKRITAGWEKVAHSSYQTAALVTHGGPIRCMLREIFKQGEIGTLGDCAVIEFSDESGNWRVVSVQNAEL